MIFQAKHDVRYYLNGICFAPDGKLYATDGHRLFVGEHESEDVKENIILDIQGPRFTRFDYLEADTDTGVVTYFSELGTKVGLALGVVIDGRYPDVERVIPKDNQAVSEIRFNAKYLADIEKVAKLYNPQFTSICIKPNGNEKSSKVDFQGPHGKATMIIMPMRA